MSPQDLITRSLHLNSPSQFSETNAAQSGSVDPLVALEKSTDALKRQETIERPRIESLQSASDHYNTDPYALSTRVRKRFRQEKKIEKAIKAKDDEVKRRYGLPESLSLVREDDPGLDVDAKEQFHRARRKLEADEDVKARRLAVHAGPATSPLNGLPSSLAKSSLSATVLRNSLRHPSAFANSERRHTGKKLGIIVRK